MVARRLAAAFAAFVGGALVQAAPALAESCTFVNGTVTATISAGGEATLVVSGGEIRFGAVPAPCGGATTATANAIEIKGAVGSVERLTIDQSGGTFTPGAAPEPDLVAEIEIGVELGDSSDTVLVRGTEGADVLKLGAGGLRLFPDNDADVFFIGPGPVLSFDLLGGADDFTGMGGGGAGAAYASPVTVAGGEGDDPSLRGGNGDDAIDGGAGADSLYGEGGADTLVGGAGADRLDGGAGDDRLEGNAGLDSFYGREGNDIINAFLATFADKDTVINGGPDTDTAYLDTTDDRNSTPGVEGVVIGAPPAPPPAPTGPCVYNATARTLTITMTPGTPATLRAVGNQFFFGPGAGTACPTALLTTTNQVYVFGTFGSSDTLTVEAPGLEIEKVALDLRSSTGATDTLRVLGGSGDNTMFLTGAGVDLSGGNPDITFVSAPEVVEIHGGGGRNFLSAQGNPVYGQGGYPSVARLYAGDQGDTLYGGDANDELFGGAGNDLIDGGRGNDLIEGGGGNDDIRGNEGDDDMRGGSGNDALYGGPGADTFAGGDDDDVLDARRPVELPGPDLDTLIDGGPGNDTAYVDAGEGSRTANVETVVGDDPPPPPDNDCDYQPVGGQITVALGAGEAAVFQVVGTAVWLDGAPCGAATTTTTSRIVVSAPAGSGERVVIDQRGGAFVPGHRDEVLDPEPGDATFRLPTVSEIEFYLALGNDAGDTIVIHGTNGNDSIAVGPKGAILNGDGDTDVVVSPNLWNAKHTYELHGEGGRNTLTGMGGQGTGGYFLGPVRLFAGDLGDILSGGYGHDELYGGAGNDSIEGTEGNDLIFGGGGNDSIWGHAGNDDITGGPGVDTLNGGSGIDILRATDGTADALITGGADADTAYYDAGLESAVAETKIPE